MPLRTANLSGTVAGQHRSETETARRCVCRKEWPVGHGEVPSVRNVVPSAAMLVPTVLRPTLEPRKGGACRTGRQGKGCGSALELGSK